MHYEPTIGLDEIGKVLSNDLRRWMLLAIYEFAPCQQDLADLLGYGKSAISQNLAKLESCGLARHIREGKKNVLSLSMNAVVMRRESNVTIVCRTHDGDEVTMRFTLPASVARQFDEFRDGGTQRDAM